MPGPTVHSAEALGQARLEELAQRPNTTVLAPTHDVVRDPWPTARVRAVCECLVKETLADADAATSDPFRFRKGLLDTVHDALAFQRLHPKTFWLLTDHAVMQNAQSRAAITGMLYVQGQVESGAVTAGTEADALATRTVLAALNASPGRDTPPPAAPR